VSPPLLQARDLSVERGGRRVLEHFALAASGESITALAGPNGAGKSSALKALAGLLPSRGELSLFGRDLRARSGRERAQELAYVPQQSLLQSGIAVREVVRQGRYAHDPAWPGRRKQHPAVEQALRATDVHELRDRRWNELSGGEQRRVLLARALATEAPIILLDEPTSALDVGHALSFMRLLRELADRGRCIVVVLHDLDQVSRYADQTVLLHRGLTVAAGPTHEVLSPAHVRAVYGVELVPQGALGYRLAGDAP
jgi:iron complex transport system ATP-binding protein